jgi:hypothetical protein
MLFAKLGGLRFLPRSPNALIISAHLQVQRKHTWQAKALSKISKVNLPKASSSKSTDMLNPIY